MTPSLQDLWLWWGDRKHSWDLAVISRVREILPRVFSVLLPGGLDGLVSLGWIFVAETWIFLLPLHLPGTPLWLPLLCTSYLEDWPGAGSMWLS